MYIRPILTIFSLFFCFGAFAANVDSTGVQNNKGKKLIIHKIEPKETYYSLARKYGADPKSIMEFNNSISLQIGTIINIPTDRPFIDDNSSQKVETIAKKSTVKAKPTFDTHKVRAKETLSEIAEEYNTSVKVIQKLNNMKGTVLKIGKTIKVRQKDTIVPKTEAPVTASNTPTEEPKSDPAPKVNTNQYGLREQNERGIATWIEDENVDGTKLLVLHRIAPIGTVMKITNPMTDKSTFAKVVGKFTENESTKDVLIVLTKAVADLIGALDKRFQVIIDYGLNE